jgi:predicted membrane protein
MDNEALLLWSVIFSSIGLGFFFYGKKQLSIMPFISGLALMVYPYFVDTVSLIFGVGIILIALPYFIRF